jgi:O-methyltransferase
MGLLARAQRSPTIETLRKFPQVYRLLSLATIPPTDLVREGSWLRDFLRAKPYTMLPYSRLKLLRQTLLELDSRAVPGSVVQFGVWKGGSAALLARAEAGGPTREFWLFDSWRGQPEPSAVDITDSGDAGWVGQFPASEEQVDSLLFEEFQLPRERIHLVPGWFKETVPKWIRSVGSIALLHIDCDYYEPVRLCLQEGFPRVSPAGAIVIDDYGAWRGCQEAVDEFLARTPNTTPLEAIDSQAVRFLKVGH